MTLVRWEPFRDLMAIQNRVNRLLAGSGTGESEDEGYGSWVPAVDIVQNEHNLVIRAELPGVDKDAIEVRVENGVLRLSGRRESDRETSEGSFYRRERESGSFARSFTLPTSVDAAAITAKYKDGVLEVVLPKAESAKPKKVAIQAA